MLVILVHGIVERWNADHDLRRITQRMMGKFPSGLIPIAFIIPGWKKPILR